MKLEQQIIDLQTEVSKKLNSLSELTIKYDTLANEHSELQNQFSQLQSTHNLSLSEIENLKESLAQTNQAKLYLETVLSKSSKVIELFSSNEISDQSIVNDEDIPKVIRDTVVQKSSIISQLEANFSSTNASLEAVSIELSSTKETLSTTSNSLSQLQKTTESQQAALKLFQENSEFDMDALTPEQEFVVQRIIDLRVLVKKLVTQTEKLQVFLMNSGYVF